MQSATTSQRRQATLTMNDQEGRRPDSLSWKRETSDANIRPQGNRGDGAGSTAPNTWGAFGSRGSGSRPAGNSGTSANTNNVRGGNWNQQQQDTSSGFAFIRSGQPQRAGGWSSSQTQGPGAGSQQQRKGHVGAPSSVNRVPAGTTSAANRMPAGPAPGVNRAPAGTASAAPATEGPVAVEWRNSSNAGVNPVGSSTSTHETASSRRGQQSPRGNVLDSFANSKPGKDSSPKSCCTADYPQNPAPDSTAGAVDLGGGLTWKPRKALTREEELSRNVKSLLNKLTIEKFNVISEKIARLLEGSLKNRSEVQLIVDAMIDKAVSEPDWSEMYADLCQVLQWRSVSPEGHPDTIRKTPFMLCLLNRIQTEFEAIATPTVLVQETDDDGEERQLEEARVKRRVLGVVKLIGELFHRRLLGFKIVNDVVVELVIKSEEPDEHLVECFLQLIATVGYFIDQNPKMKVVLDSWFGRLRELQSKSCYSKRLKCVIQDTIDMRRAEWRKKIHKERAKALNDLHDQLETEEVLGGAVHAAQYGNIVVVGERTNLNGQYLGYLKEQEEIYEQRVARRMAVAGIADRRPAPVS